MKHLCIKYFLLIGVFFSVSAQKDVPKALLDSLVKQNEKAFTYFEQGKYGEAIELSNKILKRAKKERVDSIQAKSYNLLGNCYYFVNKDSLSFHYLFKARDINFKNKDSAGLIVNYNNLGANYRDFDSITKAREYFRKALDLADKMSYRKGLIYPMNNLAALAINFDNDYAYGIKNLNSVLKIIEEFDDYKNRKLLAEIYSNLYHAYYKIGDKPNSTIFFKKCEAFSKRNNYYDVLSNLYSEKAYISEKEEHYKDAFKYLEKSRALVDSLNVKKEFEKAKQIEADNFLRENREKLILVKKEKEYHEATTAKARTYNILLGLFIIGLLLSLYFVYNSNKRLNLAKLKAEKLSKVKSNFYSEISHELRTPLYAVIEISRFLLKENLNKKHKEYIESLNFSGNHLLTLVNNVLELNKVESGKFKLQSLKFNLKALIINIVESLEFALADNGNRVHINYDDKIPVALIGDSLKLSQVFINLISNAIKFTNNGNVYISTKLVHENETSVKLFFEVKDDGLGVSKEKQNMIFEDFYQENSKIEHSYKGTGLGLSIVKRIVNAMGSGINLESEIGKGTTFNFELEFTKTSKEDIDKEINRTRDYEDLKGKKILVVDDNKINLLVTKKIIKQFNMESHTVDSGTKAIEILKEEKFDCILMDLHMPKLDGYQTTSHIRTFNTETPIIALTAASTEEVEFKINPNEMNGYIMKPFITEDFIEAIHTSIFTIQSNMPKKQKLVVQKV